MYTCKLYLASFSVVMDMNFKQCCPKHLLFITVLYPSLIKQDSDLRRAKAQSLPCISLISYNKLTIQLQDVRYRGYKYEKEKVSSSNPYGTINMQINTNTVSLYFIQYSDNYGLGSINHILIKATNHILYLPTVNYNCQE